MKKSIKLCSLALAVCVLMASCNGTGKGSAADSAKADSAKADSLKKDSAKMKADTVKADSAKKDSVPGSGSTPPSGPDHPPGK